MRVAVGITGLFACSVIFSLAQQTAYAEDLNKQLALDTTQILKVIEKPAAPTPEPTTVEHVVAAEENLEKIANKYSTTWQRLFAKNTQVSDPNLIKPGDKLIIPSSSEQLAERVFVPTPAATPAPTSPEQPNTSKQQPKKNPAKIQSRGSSSGNTYYAGYCTYYAKQRRPDLPNNLGNADTWVSRARAQGIPTGSVPKVGAIGQLGMHVVYVERINGDGTILISEMNWVGRGIVSQRTVPANSHMYIY